MADESVIDPVAIETEPAEVPVEETQPESVETTQLEGTEEVQPEEIESTETQVPYAQLKAHVEELKKTNPALAKELKNTVFQIEALRKEFPGGMQEVREARQALETLGGKEGIEKIQAQKQEWESIDDKFANGDATVLDEFAKFNPEGFAKLIPAALDKLAGIDRDTYNHSLAGIFVSTLDNWRFTDTLQRLADNLGRIVDDKGNKLCVEEIKSIAKMAEQYDGLRKVAENAPKKVVDEGTKKIQEERAQIAREKAQMHSEYVSNATEVHAKKHYDSLIPAEARNQKLNLEQLKAAGSYDRVLKQIDEEIAREIVKDKQAVEKIGSSIAAGRRDEAIKLSNAKFDAVAGKVVQKVVREWATLMNPRGVTGKPGAKIAAPPTTGVKKLAEPPDLGLVDRTAPNWRDDYMMRSTAKLTTGQRVQW